MIAGTLVGAGVILALAVAGTTYLLAQVRHERRAARYYPRHMRAVR